MYKNIISCIYKIQSKIKPIRLYIGSSSNFYSRKAKHLRELRRDTHHSPKLQRHFNKYGEADLFFEILEIVDGVCLAEREQYYIDIMTPWFNVCGNAYSCLGVKRSKETKLKISKGNTGKRKTEEVKKKLSDLKKADPNTLIQIQKLAEINRGNKYAVGCKWNIGKKHSAEWEEKRASKRRGRPTKLRGVPKTEEHRRKIGDAHRGKIVPQWAIDKSRAGLLKYYETHPNARKGISPSDDVRKRMSIAKKNDPRTNDNLNRARQIRDRKNANNRITSILNSIYNYKINNQNCINT